MARLRPVSAIVIVGVASAALMLMGLAIAFSALGWNDSLWFWVVPSGCAVAIALRAVSRVGIEVSEDSIVVHNLWRSHQVPWNAVADISPAGMVWPSAAALFFALWSPLRIRTHDGRSIFVEASLDNVDRVARFLRSNSSHADGIRWGVSAR
jgi:hypothetical protein